MLRLEVLKIVEQAEIKKCGKDSSLTLDSKIVL